MRPEHRYEIFDKRPDLTDPKNLWINVLRSVVTDDRAIAWIGLESFKDACNLHLSEPAHCQAPEPSEPSLPPYITHKLKPGPRGPRKKIQ